MSILQRWRTIYALNTGCYNRRKREEIRLFLFLLMYDKMVSAKEKQATRSGICFLERIGSLHETAQRYSTLL